jgi:hypothetical protein
MLGKSHIFLYDSKQLDSGGAMDMDMDSNDEDEGKSIFQKMK